MQANHLNQIIQNNMLQHASAVNKALRTATPVSQGFINDSLGATGPLVLIGYLDKTLVYRTTHTVAHRKYALLKIENLIAKYFFRT
jgi:hypothetical protein